MIGRRASTLLPIALMLGSACAFEEGGGFATLAPGALHAEFEPEAERLLTDRGYRARLSALTLRAETFALLEAGEAETSFSEVVRVSIERDLDLLGGEEVELARYEPAAQLGQGTLDRAELAIGRIAVNAVVEGGGLEEPLQIDASFDADVVIASPMALQLGRDIPEHVSPQVALHPNRALFDGIEFSALAGDEGIVRARLRQWLETAELDVDLGVVAHTHDDREHEGHAH
jgi:hypothetical protein